MNKISTTAALTAPMAQNYEFGSGSISVSFILGKGLTCSKNSCGVGKCISTIDGFECRCPFGLTGEFCHEEIKIKQPYFDGNAYLTVPEPRHILRA